MPWWIGFAWITVLLVLAALVFALVPAWRTRSNHLTPAHLYDAQLPHDLIAAAAAVGADRLPVAYVDSLAGSSNAVVFGRNRRPILVVDAGLLRLRGRDPAKYAAILRHEFAHIVNRDITITYATVALWRVFLAVTVLPFLIWLVVEMRGLSTRSPALFSEIPFLAQELTFVAVLIVLVYLARSDVLRTREFCADLFSHNTGREVPGGEGKDSAPAGRLRRITGSFVGLWRAHPPWHLRRALLDDPAPLFALAPLPMFLIGLATGIIGGHLDAEWMLDLSGTSYLPLMTSLIPAVLVVGAGGVAVWNAAVQGAADRRPDGIAAGLWAGAGLAASLLLYDASADGNWIPDDPLYMLLAVAAGAALFWWIAQCARLWSDARSGQLGPGPMLLVLAGAALLAAAGLAWWTQLGIPLAEGLPMSFTNYKDALAAATDPGQSHQMPAVWTMWALLVLVFGNIALLPFVWLAAAAVWAVPLLGWTVRVRRAGSHVPVSPGWIPRLRGTVVTALVCGGVSWLLVIAFRVTFPYWWDFTEPQGGLITAVQTLWALLALLVTAAAAAVAGALRRPYRLLTAIIGANTAAAISLAGSFLLMATPGCLESLTGAPMTCTWAGSTVWDLFRSLLVGPSFVLATALATALAAVVALIDLLPRPAPKPRPAQCAAPLAGRNPMSARFLALTLCALLPSAAFGAEVANARLGELPEDSEITAGSLVEEDPTPPSAEVKILQLAAWRIYGGAALLEGFAETTGEMGGAFEEALRGDMAPYADLCVELDGRIEDARRYFEVPDQTLQKLWDEALSMGETGIEKCVRGEEQQDVATFMEGAGEVLGSMSVVAAVGTEIKTLAESGT
jgi:Zn-dependent protease with chaperone function